ncbi:MAG: 1-acyl-sn-glycerol-3-phosphate acyltransferase, partial [Fimbriimonadales bacterium]|nr:1-acyl-sn-glycerol-3-phosphate acyltransferase [Fimbriimonadales bacterium]
GLEHVPRRGPLLLASNHLADIDPPVVQIACPRPIHFMAKSELFQIRVLGPLIRRLGAFPVRRGEPDRTALRHALRLLERGESVGLFPEGELSQTGELLQLKPGFALLARQSGAPVVCVRVDGTPAVLPYGSVIPRPAFRRIRVRFHPPRQFDARSPAEEILLWARACLEPRDSRA